MLTPSQLATWQADRARQALIGTNYDTTSYRHRWSRGDYLQLINNGIALRTYQANKAVR